MNQGWTYHDHVNARHAGLTVLAYYAQRYKHSSSAAWRDRILAGQITVDGQTPQPETVLRSGQQLAYQRPPWTEPTVPLNFDILYQDDDLWAIAKPAGLPVLPGGQFLEHTLLRQLQHQFPSEDLVPLHRLGRGTSGVMVLARSPLARSSLSQQWRDRQVHKVYRALIGPGDYEDCFTVRVAIGRLPHPILGHVYGATPSGQFAQSECQVLRRSVDHTLLAVTILTGRPHQIRIHLAAIGYPLLDDPLYKPGGTPHLQAITLDAHPSQNPVPGDCGYHLHAHQIGFSHPRTGKWLAITCPPPPKLA